MSNTSPRPAFGSAVYYRDPFAALDWLEKAFGFTRQQFYGDRVYVACDPEGHVWSFGETVREVTREEAQVASGLKIDGWI
ncbi:hypothetical protein [Paraburkholderia silvatlantica]|uniref:Glyoxalase superfamily protein PhnB n=1 Tax=Paraburkholderia silvatlantica TaxID=321895 RepID=A0A2U1A7C6_9BURK|nr:hypothetical protein [Paraburkholderia silvatlantica]MBB2931373.1 putative glyoxalase superfamily protein PhnB [Paraburkholderia silvatlantica]PVY28194.1 hypothetical protein C7411_1172 [Paraburkholderia silvatlantica]PXW34879.1 hypothetical protein C7413_1162 [Paraburkholderia silvatlantica]PYE15184.1 hypothetical protein C7410_1352 [Paraburkholderia silvatlantica]TDQ98786.1 hypothetical protein C7412_1042 [Paraburkholderia silvatlantica]